MIATTRPLHTFSVAQPTYEGPLEAVVHLLRKRKLHVSDVNLAQITDEFSEYIKDRDDSLPELSDFIRVMSVLLLIKTKALLPKEQLGLDDEETIAKFEADLIRIEVLQQMVEPISKLIGRYVSRTEQPESVPKGFLPDETLTLDKLTSLVEKLSDDPVREETFAQVSVKRLANLKTTIESIERRLLSLGSTDLYEVIRDDMEIGDKVVHFIAILELLKQNKVYLDQSETKSVLQYHQVSTPTYGVETKK